MPFPDRPAFQAHAFDPDRANAVCRAVAFVGRKRSRAASWLDDPSRFAMFKSQQFIAAIWLSPGCCIVFAARVAQFAAAAETGRMG